MKPTPLPWTALKQLGVLRYDNKDYNKRTITSAAKPTNDVFQLKHPNRDYWTEQDDANLNFILHACNLYHELVSTLRLAETALSGSDAIGTTSLLRETLAKCHHRYDP